MQGQQERRTKMTYILFKVRIKDFAKWREIYDCRQNNHVEAGITDKYTRC